MTQAGPSSSDPRQLAAEMFLTSVGPALVKQVATILHPHGIPVMPLKGVLLQRLVYGERRFRSISDVDLVVPEDRFIDAFSILTAAGFSRARWEVAPMKETESRTLTETRRPRASQGALQSNLSRCDRTLLNGLPTRHHTSPGMPVIDERQKRLLFDMLAVKSLEMVTGALKQAEIPFAPVKGVVLSRWIYDDVRDRPYVDVDLLVSRAHFARASEVVHANAWPVFYRSAEMGEISFTVGRVAMEIHAEFGRIDLSRVTAADVLERARPDRETFPFEILRIDDVDHFLLLVTNVVKDGFTYANAHQSEDLERMLAVLGPRQDELIDRANAAALLTAVWNVATWMTEERGSTAFADLNRRLPPSKRPLLARAVGFHRRFAARRERRLEDPIALVGLALATLAPDDRALRRGGLLRVLRRGLLRKSGRDPG